MPTDKWDRRFLELAATVAGWSKDPSTKTGAVIVRPDRTIVSLGYNGLPRGVKDTEARLQDRKVRNTLTVHAEVNALLSSRESLDRCTLYSVFPTCARCAVEIMQTGIMRVVWAKPTGTFLDRWEESTIFAKELYDERGIAYEEFDV